MKTESQAAHRSYRLRNWDRKRHVFHHLSPLSPCPEMPKRVWMSIRKTLEKRLYHGYGTYKMRLSCFFVPLKRALAPASAIDELSSGSKGAIVEAIIGNDDVPFFWCLACIEAKEEEKKELLSRIIDLWVTI